MLCFESTNILEKCLPLVEYVYNNTLHSSMSKALFEIIYAKFLLPDILRTKDKTSTIDEHVKAVDTAYAQIKKATKSMQDEMRKATNEHRCPLELKED